MRRLGLLVLGLICACASCAPAGAASVEGEQPAVPSVPALPAVGLSLPLNPALPTGAGLGGWLRNAALSAVSSALSLTHSPLPAPALGFAPRADAPPALPASAIESAAQGQPQVETSGGQVQSQAEAAPATTGEPAASYSAAALPGLPGTIMPVRPTGSTYRFPGAAQRMTIIAKARVLQGPLEDASRLPTPGGGVADEDARRLGDGIWAVMMDQAAPPAGPRLAETSAASDAGNPGGGRPAYRLPSAAGDGSARPQAGADPSSLPDPSGSGPAVAAAGAPAAAPFDDVLDAAQTAAGMRAETAQRPEGLRDAVAEAAPAPGGVPLVLLQVWSQALRLFERAPQGAAAAAASWPRAAPAGRSGAGSPDSWQGRTALWPAASGAKAALSSAKSGVARPSAPGAGSDLPAGQTAHFVPEPSSAFTLNDALLYLSLLPLLAFALLYLREFQS